MSKGFWFFVLALSVGFLVVILVEPVQPPDVSLGFSTLPISIDCSLWLWRKLSLTKAWIAGVGSVPEVCEVPFAERHIGDNSWIHVHQKWQRNICIDRFQLVT